MKWSTPFIILAQSHSTLTKFYGSADVAQGTESFALRPAAATALENQTFCVVRRRVCCNAGNDVTVAWSQNPGDYRWRASWRSVLRIVVKTTFFVTFYGSDIFSDNYKATFSAIVLVCEWPMSNDWFWFVYFNISTVISTPVKCI